MSRKVHINEDECIGCGSCADICPDVFEMNHELEKSFVIKPEGGDEDCILDAMGECPMSCIFWDDQQIIEFYYYHKRNNLTSLHCLAHLDRYF